MTRRGDVDSRKRPVHAQQRVLKFRRAPQRRDAVARQRPAQRAEEARRQRAALRIENGQVGEQVVLGAVGVLIPGLVRLTPCQRGDVGEYVEKFLLLAD